MSTLSWTLSTAPAQPPEYWLLFVDGNALCALMNQAPYRGVGTYMVDLTKLDAGVALPADGAAHSYSVALVGAGAIGPQSAAMAVALPVSIAPIQLPSPPAIVWPVATNLQIL
jgi:hypothetical protein